MQLIILELGRVRNISIRLEMYQSRQGQNWVRSKFSIHTLLLDNDLRAQGVYFAQMSNPSLHSSLLLS